MAKIWYSVLGDGFGHALRSHIVLDRLVKEHDVLITASKKAYAFLKDKYPNVYEIEGQEFVYEKNSIKIIKSIKNFFLDFSFKSKYNINLVSKLIIDFKPKIIISDFEPLANYFANILKIPSININNVQVLTNCNIKFLTSKKLELKQARFLIHFLQLKSDYYMIPCFADVTPKKSNTILIDPLLRKQVLKRKPKKGNHVLVYQTNSFNTEMLEVLKKSKNNFKIYGMNKLGKIKNLEFMPYSETQILEDMRSAKYVIVNGGFTLISEALYFKKPILAIPINKQLEQEFNGYSLKERNYGDYTAKLSLQDLQKFEKKLPEYIKTLSKLNKWDNEKAFKILKRLLIKLNKESNPRFKLLSSLMSKKIKNKN